MPTRAIVVEPETLAEARRLYERTDVTVADIARLCGMSEFTFLRRAKAWGWPRRSDRMKTQAPEAPADPAAAIEAEIAAAAARRASPKRRRSSAGEDDLAALIEANCRQYLEVFAVMVDKLGSGPEAIASAERAARALAVLARAVRDVKAARAVKDAGKTAGKTAGKETAHDLDDVARLRAGVARRLAELRGAGG